MDQEDEDLDRSLFLVEEMNLDTEPTEEQILERADELEIDDLGMARQSLTRQLDPCWRPYSNRYQEIYYINLDERRAYTDHPIDMYYKILYAQQNRRPLPHFKSFPIEQISNSITLLDKEIEKYRAQTVLNVVYEQSEQHDSQRLAESALSYHQREQLTASLQCDPASLQELYQFETQFRREQEKWLNDYQKQQLQKIRIKQQLFERQIQTKKQKRVSQLLDQAQKELDGKNRLSLKKKTEDIKQQLRKKRLALEKQLDKQIEQRRAIEINQQKIVSSAKNKSILRRQAIIGNYTQQNLINKKVSLRKAAVEAQQKFYQCVAQVSGSFSLYQELIEQEYQEIDAYTRNYKRNRRKSIFQTQNQRQTDRKIEQNKFNDKIMGIRNQQLWKRSTQTLVRPLSQLNQIRRYHIDTLDPRFKPSLTLKLWKKIL